MSTSTTTTPRDTRNKRSRMQRIIDREQIATWRCEKLSERAIVEKLALIRHYRLSRAQVHADVVKIEDEWLKRTLVSVDKLRSAELAALDRQEEELWAEWHKSKQDAQTSRVKGVPQGDGSGGKLTPTELTKTSEARCADVGYQNAILAVRQRRAKLLGLDMPDTVDLTSGGDKLNQTQIIHVGVDLSKI